MGTFWRFGAWGYACTDDALTPIDMEGGQTAEDYLEKRAIEIEDWGLQIESGDFMRSFLLVNYGIIGFLCCSCCFVVLCKEALD